MRRDSELKHEQIRGDLATPAAMLRPRPTVASLDDASLASALKAGHPDAHRTAWERFAPVVRRVIRRFLGPSGDAEDAVQDVFVCLFEKVGGLRDVTALKSFIMAITVRTARYHGRRRRARRWVGLSEFGEHPVLRVIAPEPEPRRALERFYAILERVNERDRAAFILRYIEGLELTEVAAALGTSPPTARRRFTRAFERVSLLAGRDPVLVEYLAREREGRRSSKRRVAAGRQGRSGDGGKEVA